MPVKITEDDESSFEVQPPTRCPEGECQGWIKSVEWGDWRESTTYPGKEIRSLVITIMPDGNFYPIKWFTKHILERDYAGEEQLCRYPVRGKSTFYLPSRGFIEDLLSAGLLPNFSRAHSLELHRLGIAEFSKTDEEFPDTLCVDLIGKPISFQVSHQGKYANINSIGPWVTEETMPVEEETPF